MQIRITVAALAALLMASALSLVTSQHRARELFADLEAAQLLTRQSEAEGNRLRIELGRASQPAAIEAAARQLLRGLQVGEQIARAVLGRDQG